jgi:hypothetical protein
MNELRIEGKRVILERIAENSRENPEGLNQILGLMLELD